MVIQAFILFLNSDSGGGTPLFVFHAEKVGENLSHHWKLEVISKQFWVANLWGYQPRKAVLKKLQFLVHNAKFCWEKSPPLKEVKFPSFKLLFFCKMFAPIIFTVFSLFSNFFFFFAEMMDVYWLVDVWNSESKETDETKMLYMMKKESQFYWPVLSTAPFNKFFVSTF